jgi:hypothetical protein
MVGQDSPPGRVGIFVGNFQGFDARPQAYFEKENPKGVNIAGMCIPKVSIGTLRGDVVQRWIDLMNSV